MYATTIWRLIECSKMLWSKKQSEWVRGGRTMKNILRILVDVCVCARSHINDCGGLTFIQACFTSGSTNIYKLLFAIRRVRSVRHSTQRREFLRCYFCFYFFWMTIENRIYKAYIAVGLSLYLLCTILSWTECVCSCVCYAAHRPHEKDGRRAVCEWAGCKSINKQWHNFL